MGMRYASAWVKVAIRKGWVGVSVGGGGRVGDICKGGMRNMTECDMCGTYSWYLETEPKK